MPDACRLFIIYCLLLIGGCGRPSPGKPAIADTAPSERALKEQFMEANKQLMQKENDEMDFYALSHKMNFVRTASGIRYFVYKPSASGDSIRDSSMVTLSYRVFLLDGTLCYSSDNDGKKTFRIGHEDIESGIHQGLQYLKRGDQAILMIPSPLAHGLLGDFKKIPPQMPIVYDVKVE